jgi:hypothetical protein
MADYMAELATTLGLNWYPKQGPFGQKDGAVIGLRDGYLTAVGPAKNKSGHGAIGLLIRLGKNAQPDLIKAAIHQKKLKPSRADLTVDSSALTLIWTYYFSKPKPVEVANLAKSIIDTVTNLAPALEARCENCNSTFRQEIVLLDGVPGYYCDVCQQQVRQELDKAGMEYERLPVNFPRGLACGMGAALLGSLAWGGIAFWLNYIYVWVAVGIGYFVAWAVAKGMGKVDRAGQVLTFVLTIASVLVGDMFFYSLVAAQQAQVPLSLGVLQVVLAHFWELETEESGIFSVLFGLGGALAALHRLKKPKFLVRFERLGSPAP